MIRRISLLLIASSFGVVCCYGTEGLSARRDGLTADVSYRVVDQDGLPVKGAVAMVSFRSYGEGMDDVEVTATSDTNGVIFVSHRFNDRISIAITKPGYYRSFEEIQFADSKNARTSDGRWTLVPSCRPIVLRKVLEPISLAGGTRVETKIPRLGCWLPYDFERNDWVAPEGSGVFADALFRFARRVDCPITSYELTMEVSFTNNPCAGLYIMQNERNSEFVSVYRADTNGIYISQKSFCLSRSGETIKRKTLELNSYAVYRTRTRVSSDGKLLDAHYGKIYGPWTFNGSMIMRAAFFNKMSNDNNLEDDHTLLNSQWQPRRGNSRRKATQYK